MRKLITIIGLLALSALFCAPICAENFPASLFPLENYSQDVDQWLSPNDPNYKKPVFTAAYQKERLEEFHRHVFSTRNNGASPWSPNFVAAILNKNPGVWTFVKDSLTEYSNKDKPEKNIGYGENFRPHSAAWIKAIANNIDLQQFALPIQYKLQHRAIVTRNTFARMLPTHDPHFYNYQIPGQGYPFDNLQASTLWVGTPVYIIGKTKDGAWSLVMTSSFIAWVMSEDVANVSSLFVERWEKFAKLGLAAITHTETPITDNLNKKYQFTAYVGAVFPFIKEGPKYFTIWIPLRDGDGNASIHTALVKKEYAATMPLAATPEHFAMLMKTLQNRPYGWGGSYFYNDCSAEMQSLFTPLGIWLPRNSSKQSRAGKMVDKTDVSSAERLAYLMSQGHPLATIIYVGGHVLLYVGNYPDPRHADRALMAMSYQTAWGLSPKDGSRRAIIGQSAFIPLLAVYPEDKALNPVTNTKRFQVVYLDEWPDVEHKDTDLFF